MYMLCEQKCEQDREHETNTPVIRNTRNVKVRKDAKEEKVKALPTSSRLYFRSQEY